MNEAIIDVVKGEKHNGYTPSSGCLPAREAIVKKYSNERAEFKANDVWLTFGASGAIYTIMQSVCEEGDNILFPKPGFPLAKTIAENLGVEIRFYDLDAENNFDIKLDQIDALVDDRTKIFMVINPSNPCGSVFSKDHMIDIAAKATEHGLLIVSDEIYYGLSYDKENPFYPFAEVAPENPIISIGGISKIYCVPGWRVGWVIAYNRHNFLDDIIDGMNKVSMIWLHPCSLV